MIQSKQKFLKGINRRFSRKDSVSPDFFYTLQNSRIFSRGDTGKIQRIKGFQKWNTNTTDYSKTLDVIAFKDKLIVFYEDAVTAGTFHVDIFNDDGTLATTTRTYSDSGGSISKGHLVSASDVVFIRPHNKILYYTGSDWILNDYISEIPEISVATQGTGNQATGTITPNSSVSQYAGSKALGQIVVLQNNTSRGDSDVFKVEFDGVQTADITVTYNDTEEEIAKKIYDALSATTLNDTKWTFSLSKNIGSLSSLDSAIVFIEAQSAGTTQNGVTPRIINSSYNITEEGDLGDFGSRLRDGIPDSDIQTKDLMSSLSSTILAKTTSGGSGAKSNLGPLYIRFNDPAFTVETVTISAGDTANTVATKINNALNASSEFAKYYTATISLDTVTIKAKEKGKKFNTDLALKFNVGRFFDYSEVFSVSETNLALTGGTNSDDQLTLNEETDYWYKVRYRYLDGHFSKFSEPRYIYSGPSKAVKLTVQTPEKDLDGGQPKLQIYRKEEADNFFLVDEIDTVDPTTTYTDTGDFEKEPEDITDNIWVKQAQTQDIVENRLVLGNIEYFDDNYSFATDFNVTTGTVSGDKVSPINTKARVFMRPKYKDGTVGYHTQIGELNITGADQSIQVEQTASVTNTEKTVEELAFFANYLAQNKEANYPFNSIEIANKNIPTIEDSNFFPANTRVFFGFKYLEVWKTVSDMFAVYKVFGWDTQRDEDRHGGFVYSRVPAGGPINNAFPQKITAVVFGLELTYIRWGYRQGPDSENAVYKLENFEALNDAASTGNLSLRLNSSSVDSLSRQRSDNEIYGEKVKVTRLIDKSAEYEDLQIQSQSEPILEGPADSRLYLELEESPLDDIDNENLNKYTFRQDYSDKVIGGGAFGLLEGVPTKSQDTRSYTLSFELINFQENSNATFEPYTQTDAAADGGVPITGDFDSIYYKYNWDEAVYDLLEVQIINTEKTLIYIGKKDNALTTKNFEITGYERSGKDNINASILANYNIYENVLLAKDLNLDKKIFENQIIWSEPLISGETYSGGRTLDAGSFFDIGADNGKLLELKSLNNILFAFCEKGVGRLNIGEVLTQQRGGEVFVDTSRFIGDFWWVQYNLKDMKEESIRRVQNSIFYTDGYDVFQLSGQGPQNITQGIIPLDPQNDYAATVDEKNFEYKLSDLTNGESWIYNYEFGMWYGPFTYATSFGDNIRNKVFSVIGSNIVEHNIGNTFDGASYATIIESVANDTQESFVDKNYRKFYLQTNNDTNAVFRYGKDHTALVSKNVSAMRSRNDYKHQGVAPAQGNSKIIYWELESTDNGFELADISWTYREKNRR